MRLSEAIRLGAMIRPQTYFYWFHDGGSCAIGAALEAVGAAVYSDCFFRTGAPKAWEWSRMTVACPACEQQDQAQEHLRHLNNVHRWTRERIADWVATIEPQPVAVDAHMDSCQSKAVEA